MPDNIEAIIKSYAAMAKRNRDEDRDGKFSFYEKQFEKGPH